MNKITTSEIKKVLDEYYKRHREGDKSIKNILFLGGFNVGKFTTITKWFAEHEELFLVQEAAVQMLKRDENGEVVAKNNFFTDGEMEWLFDENSALLIGNINWWPSKELIAELKIILESRKYITQSGKEYDLSNIFSVIATGFADVSKSTFTAFDEIKNLFDIYYVEPTVSGFIEYFKEAFTGYFKTIEERKEDLEEKYNECIEIYRRRYLVGTCILNANGFNFVLDYTKVEEPIESFCSKEVFTPLDFMTAIHSSIVSPKDGIRSVIKYLRREFGKSVTSELMPILKSIKVK